MKRPKRSDDKYWTGTRDFDERQYRVDLDTYICHLEASLPTEKDVEEWVATARENATVDELEQGHYQLQDILTVNNFLKWFKERSEK